MKNSDYLFNAAKSYQNARKDIVYDYEHRMKRLESAKGSLYYKEEAEKAQEQMNSALSKIKKSFINQANDALTWMRKKNAARTIAAPTEEELRLVESLKMRETITRDELELIANSIKNPICMEALREVAIKNGVIGGFAHEGAGLTIGAVDEMINDLAHSLTDFVAYDTTKSSRHIAEKHAELYGNDNTPLRKRALFDTKTGCFNELGIGGNIDAFLDAVD